MNGLFLNLPHSQISILFLIQCRCFEWCILAKWHPNFSRHVLFAITSVHMYICALLRQIFSQNKEEGVGLDFSLIGGFSQADTWVRHINMNMNSTDWTFGPRPAGNVPVLPMANPPVNSGWLYLTISPWKSHQSHGKRVMWATAGQMIWISRKPALKVVKYAWKVKHCVVHYFLQKNCF